MKSSKPIRIFFSELSCRFYASRAYREGPNGIVTITGEKFDVTNEIAGLIEAHGVTFAKRGEADSTPMASV
jgi:hypothetical protein